MPDTATIVVHAYNGARQLFPANMKWTAQTRDGRSQNGGQKHLFFDITGPSAALTVDFFDNLFDQYTVIGNAQGYDDSAWYPVHVTDEAPVDLHLMFLAKDATPQFGRATWTKLQQSRRSLADIIMRGCQSANDADDKYSEIIEHRRPSLACFLNIMTALADMRLPSGKGPLDYYWNLAWPAGDSKNPDWLKNLDNVFKQDRFFCYVDQALVADVRDGVGRGFAQEPNPQAWGHGGATESYKQTQFDMANVQLTFHGRDTATFLDSNGLPVTCVKIEPDIDYYKDVAAHGLVEVLPNWITKGITDPRIVYAVRWMTSKREGLPDFDPLFTVEAQGTVATA